MNDYNEEYKQGVQILTNTLAQKKLELQQIIKRYNALSKRGIEQSRLQEFQESILRKKYEITDFEEHFKFLRPKNDEDIEYRKKIINGNFCNKIKELIPDNSLLRFHGTPIHRAEAIIKSGEISSSKDRLGFETSTNNQMNQISVTTKENIGITISYLELNLMDFPAGCIFVVLPKDDEDAKNAELQNSMENVNFKNEPNRLYGIITSQENIKRVIQWSQESGINTNKIYDFNKFISILEIQKEQQTLQSQTISMQEVISNVINNCIGAEQVQKAASEEKMKVQEKQKREIGKNH